MPGSFSFFFLHFNILNTCRNICRILLNVEHPGNTLDLKRKLDCRGGVQQGAVRLFDFGNSHAKEFR